MGQYYEKKIRKPTIFSRGMNDDRNRVDYRGIYLAYAYY